MAFDVLGGDAEIVGRLFEALEAAPDVGGEPLLGLVVKRGLDGGEQVGGAGNEGAVRLGVRSELLAAAQRVAA